MLETHILAGDDCRTKFRSKHVAVKMDPVEYLENFAEDNDLFDNEVTRAEEYLVRVWAGASVKTFAALLKRSTNFAL